jgi:hypothetical protein
VYTDSRGCPPNSETPDCFFMPLTRCQVSPHHLHTLHHAPAKARSEFSRCVLVQGFLDSQAIASSVQYQPWVSPADSTQAAALKADRVVSLGYHRSPVVQFYVPPPWATKSRKHEDVWWWRKQTTRWGPRTDRRLKG